MSKNIITRKSNIAVDELIREKYPVISMEEESVLLKRIELSDKKAMDIFCKSNTRYLIAVVKKYLDKGLTFDELLDAGRKGLEQVCEKFDPNRGFKFAAYAAWFIKRSIENSIG